MIRACNTKGKNGLKGQQAHSPGHRPGYECNGDVRPVRAKEFDNKAFALTGRVTLTDANIPRTCPGLTAFCPFGANSGGSIADKQKEKAQIAAKIFYNILSLSPYPTLFQGRF